MNAIQAVDDASTAGESVSIKVQSCLYELEAAVKRVRRTFTGAPTEVAMEAARRDLGRAAAVAETLRRQLPDPHGLRGGTGAQRAVRAVARFMTEHQAFPSAAMVAAMTEASPNDGRAFLFRARLKGWVRVVETTPGNPDADRWGLTPAGREFTGFTP